MWYNIDMKIIDFHSHILPGIDDGSKSYEEVAKLTGRTKEEVKNTMVETFTHAGATYKPKTKKKDAIEVSKIIFVSPSLTQKLIKKKINSKISKLLLELNTFYEEDEGDTSSDGIRVRDKLLEAEKLKANLINNYKKYLDGNYTGLTLKKLQIIIDGYNSRMNRIINQKQKEMFMQILARQNYMEEDTKKGKGR